MIVSDRKFEKVSGIVEKAMNFAEEAHRGQTYGELPYFDSHIMHVYTEAVAQTDDEFIHVSSLLHDVIEDCGIGKYEIEEAFGRTISLVVSTVSDPAGTSRKERKELFYQNFKDTKEHMPSIAMDAAIVKCLDRKCNQANSIKTNDLSKLSMYIKEFPRFMRDVGSMITEFNDGKLFMELIEQYADMKYKLETYR